MSSDLMSHILLTNIRNRHALSALDIKLNQLLSVLQYNTLVNFYNCQKEMNITRIKRYYNKMHVY